MSTWEFQMKYNIKTLNDKITNVVAEDDPPELYPKVEHSKMIKNIVKNTINRLKNKPTKFLCFVRMFSVSM